MKGLFLFRITNWHAAETATATAEKDEEEEPTTEGKIPLPNFSADD